MATRLIPPADGVIVRMYRIGHGDCFLIAFPGKVEDKPVYVLIDCGYKPGSPGFLKSTPKAIAASIREATDGHLDVVVITHEHQDHLNAFTASNFSENDITIGQAWFAWTEDPDDTLANKLRVIYKDQLLGLSEARNRLAAAGDIKSAEAIDEFLAFELGGEEEIQPALLGAAAKDPAKSQNKQAMKLVKDRAKHVVYLRPHEKILTLPGNENVRVFALGPPRDEDALSDLNPQGDEEFHLAAGLRSPANYFAAAARTKVSETDLANRSPFSRRYALDLSSIYQDPEFGQFFTNNYGHSKVAANYPDTVDTSTSDEVASNNAEWRRIDNDWLYSAEDLALAMNGDTNNASLVLAFELGKGGKVLLFAADAQRGNWLSWGNEDFSDDGNAVSAKDLLGRTVLYKVGHHCSHNATINGRPDDDFPNIGWMARGKFAQEFTAMITAVPKWAQTQKGWDHPRKEIKDALIKKASGRVLQTDTNLDDIERPPGVSASEWDLFLRRTSGQDLFFDFTVMR
ncbi:MAG: hypothetical protein JNJ77_11300 [Planctomycetia bacterium]|nr:hypothetical protein [Planctomycetia bacterium]